MIVEKKISLKILKVLRYSSVVRKRPTKSVAGKRRQARTYQLGDLGRCKPPPPMGARGKAPENFQILHPPDAWKQRFTTFFTAKGPVKLFQI